MPSHDKRFRIEGSLAALQSRRNPETCGCSVHPGHAAPEPSRPRSGGAGSRARGSREQWFDLERLAAELHAMRAAISTTKREIADLQHSPSGADGIHRAAGELDAVSAATERATTTILAAVEEIEMAANVMKSAGLGTRGGGSVDIILDRVLALYEACNFQDVTGQRIRKVVTTLKFVEERLDRVVSAWDAASGVPTLSAASCGPDSGPAPLSGPGLPGDRGHVSQSDVDAFFA